MAAAEKKKSRSTDTHKKHLGQKIKKSAEKISRSKKQVPAKMNKENLLRSVIDALPDSLYVKDLDCRKIVANLADVRMMGCQSESDVIGYDDFKFFPKSDAEKFFADDRSVITNGQPVINREESFYDKQGRKHWLLTSKLPLWDDSGNVSGLVGIGRDITKLKEAEETVHFERNLSKILLDNVPDLIYFKDAEGRYVLNSLKHLQSMGMTKQEDVSGKTSFDFHPAELAKRYYEDEMNVIRSGEALLDREEIAFNKDLGENRWHLTSKIPFKDSEGNSIGLICISRDITARKNAELKQQEQLRIIEEKNGELEIARDKAMQASKAKSSFLANISHELRTPLNGIIGMTDLALHTTQMTDEQKRYLSGVKSSGEILLALINDVLDFSKIEAGKLELNQIDFSLRDELAAALQPLGARADEKSLELFYDVDQDVPDWIRGDAFRLKQIIINLVGNAIKFTGKGEIKVTVKIHQQKNEKFLLHFSVVDTGIGIPKDKQKIIFESFTQADSSISRRFGGTGLGLAISSRLVDLMGGSISLESEVNKGSTFLFTAEFSKAATYGPIIQQDFLTGVPVLVVDDNDSIREVLEKILKNWRMDPTVVGSGTEALAALRTAYEKGKPFPLVLLDIRLPDVNGFDVIDQAAAQGYWKEMSVIVISMSHKPEDVERLQQKGVTTYLSKPFSHSELLEAIQTVLAKRSVAAGGVHTPIPVKTNDTKKLLDTPPQTLLRILVAEDNTMNQEVAKSILMKRGHSVTIANNGKEAVALFHDQPFDIILMDIQMPFLNGFDATAAIREMEKSMGGHIPIIAVTANAMKEDEKLCLASGMDYYLSKPLRMLDLIRMVERVQAAGVGTITDDQGSSVSESTIHSKERIIKEIDGDEELLQTIVALCLEELPRQMMMVKESIEQKDAQKLEIAAHTIKGMVKQFGGHAAGNLALQLEEKGNKNDFTETKTLLSKLLTELDTLMLALKDLSH